MQVEKTERMFLGLIILLFERLVLPLHCHIIRTIECLANLWGSLQIVEPLVDRVIPGLSKFSPHFPRLLSLANRMILEIAALPVKCLKFEGQPFRPDPTGAILNTMYGLTPVSYGRESIPQERLRFPVAVSNIDFWLSRCLPQLIYHGF